MKDTGLPNSETSALSLIGLSRTFGTFKALDDISLEIKEGEFFTIVGPSGSGKTTMLRILAGLDHPSAGSLLLRGEDITRLSANKRPTAMVFQSLALFDHRSVGENVEFSLKMRGISKADRRKRASELLDLVQLGADYYSRSVTQCSGGERQRVALARALASDPEILFFDEPLSALDYRLRKTLEVELRELQHRTGRTFVYITHSLEEAMVMSDRIGIMRDGKLVQIGSPAEIYGRPKDRFVARFMGEVNIFEVEDGKVVGLNEPVSGADARYLIVRPEALRPISPEHGGLQFEVTVKEVFYLGSRVQLHLDSAAGHLVSELPAPCALKSGQTTRFGFDPTKSHGVSQ